MVKKEERFVLTKESKIAKDGKTKLYRLKVQVGFKHKIIGKIKAGIEGGWVESLFIKNGNARISDNAWVSDDAEVYGNAKVFGNARVFGNAEVYGNAKVSDDAEVYGNARVFGNAEVYGNARVYGNAMVSDDAEVYGNAIVSGRFDLKVKIDFELSRIVIDTKEKLKKLKDFLDKFDEVSSNPSHKL